jgi:NADPH-dependent curcumin reductase CurA
MARKNRQWILARRPHGVPVDEDFALVETPVPEPGEGEFVTRNLILSVDPAQRGWMDEGGNYFPPIPLGAPVTAGVIGEVIASRHPDFREGERLYAIGSWSEYSLLGSGFVFRKLPADAGIPLPKYNSLLGGMGCSALIALERIGKPTPGETLFISGAAGNMGSIAGQIGRLMGLRVIGSAGGPAKCRYLTEQLGFDAVVDYKAEPDLPAALRRVCPEGIDIYYDNVGGPMLEAVLDNIRPRARIIMNGSIAEYNDTEPRPGPRNLWALLVKRASIQGFLLPDFADDIDDALARLEAWYRDGKLDAREDVRTDFEQMPAVFRALFDGTNTGKLMVKLGE